MFRRIWGIGFAGLCAAVIVALGASPGSAATLMGEAQTLLATSMDVQDWLPAFTSNVADILRLDSKGRVVPGHDADLLVIDENGIVSDVMALGQWHVRDREIKIRGHFE